MATGRITKRTLDALMANTVAGFLWDEDLKGFGLKISSGGTASYVIQYRMGGREAKTKRYTIGGHGSPWTPATAREEASRMLMLVAQGIDPSNRTSSGVARRSISPSPTMPTALPAPVEAGDGRRW